MTINNCSEQLLFYGIELVRKIIKLYAICYFNVLWINLKIYLKPVWFSHLDTVVWWSGCLVNPNMMKSWHVLVRWVLMMKTLLKPDGLWRGHRRRSRSHNQLLWWSGRPQSKYSVKTDPSNNRMGTLSTATLSTSSTLSHSPGSRDL